MLERKQLDTILLSDLPTEVKIYRIADKLRRYGKINYALWYAILDFKNEHIEEYEWVESESKRMSKDELWAKAGTNQPITCEDIGLPSWRSECDGLYYELESLICRSGIAYKHINGYRWADGIFLTKRECNHYGLECGSLNTK